MADHTPDERAESRFAEEVFTATDLAMAGSESSVHHLDVAGVPVLLEIASRGMAEILMPALQHIEDPPDVAPPPEVRLQAWDSISTGVQMAPPPVPRIAFTPRGDLVGFGAGRHLIAFNWSESSVCLLDRRAGRGVYWVQDAQNLPYWVRSAPLRTLLHWILMDRGRHVVHGAVVGDAQSGVLLAGNGGSGKSTTALRCLAAGMLYLGDDYVAVAADPPRAYSLYSTAKLFVADSRPVGRPLIPPAPEDEKVVLSLDEPAARLTRRLPLRALATLRFCDQEASALERVERETLLHAATFTTLSQLPHAGAALNRLMEDLMSQVETVRVRLGRDPDSVVSAVREIVGGQPAIEPSEPESMPLISVVIPVHDGARFLTDAVASALAQEYPALELIIVDDGSTDDIERVVADLPVDVRYFRQPRQGPAAARNAGIAAARGEFLAFLDVDDLWPPGALETLVRSMLVEECEVAAGWAQMARYDEATELTTPYGNPQESFPFYVGAALYRRSVFDAVGLFDSTMQYGEDVDWFARLRESGRALLRLPMETLIVRRHSANMTHGKDPVELGMVRALKNSLDRRRVRGG